MAWNPNPKVAAARAYGRKFGRGPVDLRRIKIPEGITDALGGWYGEGGPQLNWLIIGAYTGKGAIRMRPGKAWVQNLIDQGRAAGVPIFLKDNLRWPEKIQEWPA